MIWLTFLPVALYDICGWASPAVEAVRTDSSCSNPFGIVNSTNLGNVLRKSVRRYSAIYATCCAYCRFSLFFSLELRTCKRDAILDNACLTIDILSKGVATAQLLEYILISATCLAEGS